MFWVKKRQFILKMSLPGYGVQRPFSPAGMGVRQFGPTMSASYQNNPQMQAMAQGTLFNASYDLLSLLICTILSPYLSENY